MYFSTLHVLYIVELINVNQIPIYRISSHVYTALTKKWIPKNPDTFFHDYTLRNLYLLTKKKIVIQMYLFTNGMSYKNEQWKGYISMNFTAYTCILLMRNTIEQWYKISTFQSWIHTCHIKWPFKYHWTFIYLLASELKWSIDSHPDPGNFFT